MKRPALAALAACVLAPAADAFEVRVRWIQRDGLNDIVLPDNTITVAPGSTTRYRLQFGVFDDEAGPAPAGGFIRWNVGTLVSTGGMNARTPGRIAPFNFAPNPPANGLPTADPWMALTRIDNTLGTQFRLFGFPPIVRGLNTFISTYEITSVAGAENYTITASGAAIVAQEWRIILIDEKSGDILYGPLTLPPIPFQGVVLTIIVPGPGPAALLGLGGVVAVRRRRT